MKKLIFRAFIGITLLIPQINQAQMIEIEATPSVLLETGAIFQIIEISFKNPEADFVKIRYVSPTGKAFNLKGIGFKDDSIFKTISTDTWIASGQELLLTFKSSAVDNIPYLSTSRTGLTGTTEQFIIVDKNETVLDAVCWTSSTPTTSEIEDLQKLFESEGWNSSDIASCISSDEIKSGESIFRKPGLDTNSKSDWTLPQAAVNEKNQDPVVNQQTNNDAITEPGPIKIPAAIIQPSSTTQMPTTTATTPIPIQTAPIAQIIPLTNKQISSPTKNSEIKSTNPGTKTSKSTKKKSSSIKYQDGDLSEQITITEILPNPEKEDSKNEWIEVTNLGQKSVNLGNWQLDDGEGGSKPFTIPDDTTIEPGASYLFPITQTHLSLSNSQDRVQLSDFTGNVVNEIEYTEAPSGESYALFSINRDEEESLEWIWTKELTPGEPNPVLKELIAEIITEPEFGNEYKFEVNLMDKVQPIKKTILFDESIVPGPLAETSFTKGTKLKLLVEAEDENTYRLKQYEIIEQANSFNETDPYIFISVVLSLVIGTAIGGYYIFRKADWQKVVKKEPAPKVSPHRVIVPVHHE